MELPDSSLAARSDEALVGIIQRGDGSGDIADGSGGSAEAFGLFSHGVHQGVSRNAVFKARKIFDIRRLG